MKAFEIYLNGRYVLTAGIDRRIGILHALVEIYGPCMSYMVRGHDPDARETVDWSMPQPVIGDEITIKIVEADQLSPVHRRFPWKATGKG